MFAGKEVLSELGKCEAEQVGCGGPALPAADTCPLHAQSFPGPSPFGSRPTNSWKYPLAQEGIWWTAHQFCEAENR